MIQERSHPPSGPSPAVIVLRMEELTVWVMERVAKMPQSNGCEQQPWFSLCECRVLDRPEQGDLMGSAWRGSQPTRISLAPLRPNSGWSRRLQSPSVPSL